MYMSDISHTDSTKSTLFRALPKKKLLEKNTQIFFFLPCIHIFFIELYEIIQLTQKNIHTLFI